jgi:glycosyltransferase involved in cell wall biosynthesis
MPKPKVTVVLPAYNAEKTLEKTLRDIPRDIVDRIILVDDQSKDGTVELAKKLDIEVFVHEKNGGYGANQKTCYKLALEDKPDIIIMIHPDYQYDPKVIKYLVGFIDEGYCDVMLGSRIRSKKEVLENGMPYYKYIANRIMSTFESFVSGYALSDWHSGMRAYKREVLENIPFQKNADDFVFDSQVLFEIIEKKYRIGEIPVPVRYFKEASSIDFLSSVKYGLLTLFVVFKFLFRKIVS